MIYGPKKNAAFTFYLPLVTKGATDWKDAPTLAAGDVQVKKDAGAFGNITTLPALDAAGEKVVKVALTAGEMNGDVVIVRFIDQTNPKEWEDTGVVIVTTANGVGLQSGDAYARLGAPVGASIAADLVTIAAYVDTEVAAIKAKTDNLPASPAAVGSAMTLTSGERDAVAAALLDLAAGVEAGLTVRQALRLALAALAGKLSGAGTTTEVFRNAVADSKPRITATVDASGNRSAITTDLS
jgi:hypothetical protein